MHIPSIKFAVLLFRKHFSSIYHDSFNRICIICIAVFNICLFPLIPAQHFGNCDYYQELKPGTVYTITSPNYNKPYPPGTFCRYTGFQFEHALVTCCNYNFWFLILLNCLIFSSCASWISNQLEMHRSQYAIRKWSLFFRFLFYLENANFFVFYLKSDRCSGDRLQVSRAGNSNLSDSERFCSGPFSVKSFSQRLVMGKCWIDWVFEWL